MTVAECINDFIDLGRNAKFELLTWQVNAGTLQVSSRQLCTERTKEFATHKEWQKVREQISKGLTNYFSAQNESRVQDRFANYLVQNLNDTLIPTFSYIHNLFQPTIVQLQEIFKQKQYDDFTDEERRLHDNNHFWRELADAFFWCCRAIIDKIQEFLPDLYDTYEDKWSQYINLNYKAHFMKSDSDREDPQSKKVGRFNWAGRKNDLTEIIYALFKTELIRDTATGKPVERRALISAFENLLGVNLNNFDKLLTSKLDSYQTKDDGKTFLSELQRHVEERAKGKEK